MKPRGTEIVLARGHAAVITFQLSNAQRAHTVASGITGLLGWRRQLERGVHFSS